jgi:hypothetical protein
MAVRQRERERGVKELREKGGKRGEKGKGEKEKGS